MFIAAVAAPVFDIPVNAPVAAVLVWFRIILEFMLTVAAAAEFDIHAVAPVPEFVPDMILLLLIFSVPVLPEFAMPLKTEAAVPYTEQF